MIYINECGLGWSPSKRVVASGENAENALENLVAALNADEVDVDNCMLEIETRD